MTNLGIVCASVVVAGLLVGCGDEGADGTGGGPAASSSGAGASGVGGAGGSEACDDPSTDVVGEYSESRTLKRACSPYRLKVDGGHIGATFLGDGVVLTIEDGVTIQADEGARLEIVGDAKLVAGAASGEEIVFESHPDAEGPWEGLQLGEIAASKPVVHEMHRVTFRGAAGIGTPEAGDAVIYLTNGGDERTLGLLIDDVTIDQPPDTGMRVSREPNYIAPGSQGLVVKDAGGYPLVMDAQNLDTLPPEQDVSSTDAAKNRILVFSGNEGLLTTDYTWPVQSVPIELGSTIDIGTGTTSGSLTLPPTGTFLLRPTVKIRVNRGELVAVGEDPDCKDDGDCSLVFDWAIDGQPWPSIIFTSTGSGAMTSQLRGVRFANGGNNEPMVFVIAATGPGVIGDCVETTTIEGCYFELSPKCLAATDSQNEYASLNGFSGCSADVKCD